jgi:hypothetical protein
MQRGTFAGQPGHPAHGEPSDSARRLLRRQRRQRWDPRADVRQRHSRGRTPRPLNRISLQHNGVDFSTNPEAERLIERYSGVIGLPGMQERLISTSLDAGSDGSG